MRKNSSRHLFGAFVLFSYFLSCQASQSQGLLSEWNQLKKHIANPTMRCSTGVGYANCIRLPNSYARHSDIARYPYLYFPLLPNFPGSTVLEMRVDSDQLRAYRPYTTKKLLAGLVRPIQDINSRNYPLKDPVNEEPGLLHYMYYIENAPQRGSIDTILADIDFRAAFLDLFKLLPFETPKSDDSDDLEDSGPGGYGVEGTILAPAQHVMRGEELFQVISQLASRELKCGSEGMGSCQIIRR